MNKVIETSIKVEKSQEELHIRNKLPQIIVPADKVDVFIEWWNEDIRFLQDIPRSFDEGYLIIHNNIFNINNGRIQSVFFTKLAKHYNTTYRAIENYYKEFKELSSLVTLYFRFIDNHLRILLYGSNKKIMTAIELDIGSTGEAEEVILKLPVQEVSDFATGSFTRYNNYFNMVCTKILITSLWYIATTNSSKYYYERDNSKPEIIDESKNIVKVKKYKTISTPVYDFNKVREIKVDRCIKRRKGWTYSHSFQVHGHYRHYKNGKVVFVKPFIKGKDKEFKSQIIMLEPNK